MSAYEVWIFTEEPGFPGGLVKVEEAPESYGYGDAQQLANLRELEYRTDGLSVTTIVRSPTAY